MDKQILNEDKNADKLGTTLANLAIARDCVVREGGLEPPHLAAQDPKSCVSTSSTTLAIMYVRITFCK